MQFDPYTLGVLVRVCAGQLAGTRELFPLINSRVRCFETLRRLTVMSIVKILLIDRLSWIGSIRNRSARYGHGFRSSGSRPRPSQPADPLTKDQDFGNVLDYPPHQHHGIAVVEPPARIGRAGVLALVEQLLRQKFIIDILAGRLAIIQPGRIRLRPPP